MALTNTPAWPQMPRYRTAGVTTANSATDGSGTITSLLAAGDNGTRITGLYAGASASVTATAVRFFVSHNGGSNWAYLPHLEALIPAHTLGATTLNGGRVTIIDQSDPADLFDLPPDTVLGFAIAVTIADGQVIAVAMGADY